MNNIKKRLYKCSQGHEHDSKPEAVRCNELAERQRNGEISGLKTQVEFDLLPKFTKRGEMPSEQAVRYIADFTYCEDGSQIVEDVKSSWTQKDGIYRLKRKMFKHRYCEEGSDIIFREVVR